MKIFISFLLFLLFSIVYSALPICPSNKLYSTSIQLEGGTSSDPSSWSLNCEESARNLTIPMNFQEIDTNCSFNTWGPYPKAYPKPRIPDDCNVERWMQTRVLAAMDYIISKGNILFI